MPARHSRACTHADTRYERRNKVRWSLGRWPGWTKGARAESRLCLRRMSGQGASVFSSSSSSFFSRCPLAFQAFEYPFLGTFISKAITRRIVGRNEKRNVFVYFCLSFKFSNIIIEFRLFSISEEFNFLVPW